MPSPEQSAKRRPVKTNRVSAFEFHARTEAMRPPSPVSTPQTEVLRNRRMFGSERTVESSTSSQSV